MYRSMKNSRWRGAALVALAIAATPLAAQEVVQPLPPEGSDDLNSALQRLARNSGDVAALLDAGEAALKLGDIPAAIGFFGRAQDIAPANSRITLGLARAYTYSRRPVEALQLFAEAERAGVAPALMAADRGLAFDLVGDAASAQALYRLALSQGENSDIRRNLALSQAISGDKAGFEATLLPLLQQGDNAAFRTRAFGLAVLGEVEAAVKIARDMMPTPMASRVEPYLRYMPQLTPAQQAAAGTLGVFPRTAAIGRDDPAIAGFDSSAVRGADAGLAPQGPPMGSQLERTRAQQQAQAQRPAPAPTPAPSPEPRRAAPQVASTIPAFERSVTSRPRIEPVVQRPAPPPPPPPAPAPAPTPTPAPTPQIASTVSEPVVVARGELPATTPVSQAAPPPPPSPAPPPTAPAPAEPEPSVADAFADFDLAQTSATPRAGAVDITRIKAPREVEAPPPPPPPKHPARHWVQVATGKDLKALGFDWRRISRKADGALDKKGPFTTPWGEANRLLAGPYESRDAARAMVTRLKELEIDSFPFSSDEGQEIAPLD